MTVTGITLLCLGIKGAYYSKIIFGLPDISVSIG
jgi:hypothetical protein